MSHTIAETRRMNPMWMYEKNYSLLMHVFALLFKQPEEKWQYKYRDINVTICKNDAGRYTHELTLLAEFPINQYVRQVKLLVRAYHDAQLAEVIDYHALKLLQPVYSQAASSELNLFDKKQINIVLTDLLELLYELQLEGEEVTV